MKENTRQWIDNTHNIGRHMSFYAREPNPDATEEKIKNEIFRKLHKE